MPDNWEQLRAGVGCPLCAPRPDVNESVLLVRKLTVSSLYLARNQTYRGQWHLIPRYTDDGRWGGPIWTTQRSESCSLALPEREYLDRVRALAGRIDALESGIARA